MPAHDGCITVKGRLTEEEEARMTEWLMASFQSRPEDWTFGEYVLHDAKTDIDVWMANGRDYVRIYRPVESNRFSKKNKRSIWREAHKMRHANIGSSAGAKILLDLTDKEPAPPLQLPPPWWTKIAILIFGAKPAPKLIEDQRKGN